MNRLLYVDALKGILILFVMLGHSLQYVLGGGCVNSALWNVIYSFHMPCFFAASGFFARDCVGGLKGVGTIIYRRFRQLLIPMTCWQLILDFTPPLNTNVSLVKYLDCGSFWFLWALFFISAIWSIGCYLSSIIKIRKSVIQAAISLLLLAVFVVFGYKEHGFHYIAYYYPYYVLGYYLHKSSRIQNISVGYVWVLVGIWFLLSLFWRMHSIPLYLRWMSFFPETVIVTLNRYFVGVTSIIAFDGLARYYLAKDSFISKVLSFMGTMSLALYTIHVSVFETGIGLGIHLSNNTSLEIILCFLVFVVVSSLAVLIIRNNKWTSMFLLGKLIEK